MSVRVWEVGQPQTQKTHPLSYGYIHRAKARAPEVLKRLERLCGFRGVRVPEFRIRMQVIWFRVIEPLKP